MEQKLTMEQLSFARSIGAVYCVHKDIKPDSDLTKGALGKPGFVYRNEWVEWRDSAHDIADIVSDPMSRFKIDFSPLDVYDYDEAEDSGNAEKYPAYFRDVSDLSNIDVYAVHNLFGIDDASGCIQHASKKLLLSGTRTGGKSKRDDIREARDTLNRWLELNK